MTQPGALPLTYTDLVCLDDMDPNAAETTSDLQNLLQDTYHVLVEDPGSNPDDPTRGVGIDNYLSGTTDQFTGLAGVIDEQLTADPRITKSTTNIQQASSGPFPIIISIQIEVSGSVIGLQYGYATPGGLVQVNA